MTSPIRQFPRTLLLALLGITLLALTAGAPAMAQDIDDLFGPVEDTSDATGAPTETDATDDANNDDDLFGPMEGPTEATDEEGETTEDDTTAESEADEDEHDYAFHESGIPYLPGNIVMTPELEEIAEQYHLARRLVGEKKYEEAFEALNTLPTFPASVELRAQALAGLGRTDLAITTMEQAIRAYRTATGSTTTPWTMLEVRGDIYNDAELFDQAIADYTAAAELVLQDAELQSKLGMAQIRFGMTLRGTNPQASYQEIGLGIGSLEKAVEEGLDNAEIQGHLAIGKGELGDTEGAIENYLAAIAFEPEAPLYHQLLGFSYVRRASQQAVSDPDDKEAILEDFQLALDQFNTSIELDPGDFSEDENSEENAAEEDLGMDLGDSDAMTDDTAEAEETEETDYFEKLDPASIYAARADVHINMGDILSDQAERDEQYQLALDDCDLALELNDQLPDPWMYKGIALRMLGDLEPSIDAFTEALKISPNNPQASLRRGIVWYYLGEYDLALMDFEDVNQYQTDLRASFWTGLTEATRGNHFEAVEAYTDTLRVAPDHNLAHANRGLAYLHLGQPERALNDFNEMIRQDQSNADAYYYRGQALESMNDYEGARRSYMRALDWNPQQEAASYRLNSLDNL